jgi:hypothetical protein
MSSVFTKTVAVDWTGGVSAADVPSLAVIGVLATAGMLLSQAAYRGAGLAAPLATLTVVNPVVAAAVGITMFGETFRYGTTGTALALSCGVVAAGGLILLTTERLTHGQPASAEGLPAAGLASEAMGAGSAQVPARVGGAPEGFDGPPEPVAAGAEAVPSGGRLLVEDVLAAGPRTGTVSAVLVPGPGTSAAVLVPGPGTSAAVLVPGPGTPSVLVPESEATVLRGVQETSAELLVPVSDSAGAAPVPYALAAVPGPGAAGAVLAPEPENAGAVPLPGPDAVAAAAAMVASVADASYESGEPSAAAVASDDERPVSYVPYYGIPYVPLPTVDRHRMRVRS